MNGGGHGRVYGTLEELVVIWAPTKKNQNFSVRGRPKKQENPAPERKNVCDTPNAGQKFVKTFKLQPGGGELGWLSV
jgi:hypothetical protein